VIAVPLPSAALTAESCPAIVVGEIGRVAERIAARFNPLVASYAGFVETCHADTGALVVVRIGLRTIGGSNGPGPPVLPQSARSATSRRTGRCSRSRRLRRRGSTC